MSAYTTIALVRPASGFTNSVLVTDAYVTQKIAYAGGLIDGKIGSVYQLPLASTPDLVAALGLEITVALLLMDQYGEEAADKDKGWEKRFNAAMAILEDIQKLETKLFDPTTGIELTRSQARRMAYFPTGASSDPSAENSTEPQITRGRTF